LPPIDKDSFSFSVGDTERPVIFLFSNYSTISVVRLSICVCHRLLSQYSMEEQLTKDAFYQSCVHNPTIRDRLPILTRTLEHNRKVGQRVPELVELFLHLAHPV